MRTTVDLDSDVEAEVQRLRKERSLGLSEVVNELIRAGLKGRRGTREFRQKSHRLGIKIDISNVAEALDQLDGPTHR